MKILIYSVAIVAFLVAIGILVAVHEFGHYWVAKKLGFKVLRFSIGFGKPLWTRIGKDADKTEYCIAAIPLGGYVKLLDEREGEVLAAELPRSFTRKPVAHRVAVLLAGPGMNFIFAIVLYAAIGLIGTEIVKPLVGQVRADSPAALAGLKSGDLIVRVGDRAVADTEQLQMALLGQVSDGSPIKLTLRGSDSGGERSVVLRVDTERRVLTEPGKLLSGLGFDLDTWHADAIVHAVPAESAGARAGLLAGDHLMAVDGRAIDNSSQFVSVVNAALNRVITIQYVRAGVAASTSVRVPQVLDQGRYIGRLGIALAEGPRSWPAGILITQRLGLIDATLAGIAKTWEMSSMTVRMLWRMVTGQVSAKNISGPISIAEFAGISVLMGGTAFLSFLAIISVSLGVLNLMPVPLLDGGQVVFQIVEGVKGSPLSERTQIFGQQVGIALLLVLMSLAFYNDISRHLN